MAPKKTSKSITAMFKEESKKLNVFGGSSSKNPTSPTSQSSNRTPLLEIPGSPTASEAYNGPDSPGHLARRILRGHPTALKLPMSSSAGFETEEDARTVFGKEKLLHARFWKILVITAIGSSALSFSIDQSTFVMGEWRTQFTNFSNKGNLINITIFNVACCLLARLAVRTTIEAEGSGFPEMKAMLFGHILDNYLTMRVLIVKAFALTLGVGAGLPLGKEGPNCHMAACIARSIDTDFIKKRQTSISGAAQITKLLLAACAVGVGTSFSAPIGGVIFALELMLPQVYDSGSYWGCFVASVAGSLFYEVLRTWTSSGTMLLPLISSNIVAGEGATTLYPVARMFLDIGLGAICGLLGGLWVRTHSQMAGVLKRWRARGMPKVLTEEERANLGFCGKLYYNSCLNWQWRDLWGIAIGVTINTVTAASLELLNGKPQPLLLSELFDKNLMNKADEWVIPELGLAGTMICCFFQKYFMTMTCLCLAIPGGIVAPTMIIGALIGRCYILLVPQFLQDILLTMPDGSPVTDDARGAFMARFAIVGAAAFSTGVSRAFAMAITVFEVLALPNAVLPLCSATLTAIFVANKVALPFFDANLAARGLGGIPALTFTDHAMQPAFSIMKKLAAKRDCLMVHTRLYDMHNLLQKSTDAYFAIVQSTENNPEEALLHGSISRKNLDALISKLDPGAKNPEMVVDLMDSALLTPVDGGSDPLVVGLPHHCPPDASVQDVYLMMKTAHCEQVVYVCKDNCIMGMITFNSLMTTSS